MCQWRWRLLTKAQLEMAGFEQTNIVILDMLNTFLKNNNYFKAKINNILSIIYKNDLII